MPHMRVDEQDGQVRRIYDYADEEIEIADAGPAVTGVAVISFIAGTATAALFFASMMALGVILPMVCGV